MSGANLDTLGDILRDFYLPAIRTRLAEEAAASTILMEELQKEREARGWTPPPPPTWLQRKRAEANYWLDKHVNWRFHRTRPDDGWAYDDW